MSKMVKPQINAETRGSSQRISHATDAAASQMASCDSSLSDEVLAISDHPIRVSRRLSAALSVVVVSEAFELGFWTKVQQKPNLYIRRAQVVQ